jgi:hypothetical protein
VEAPARRGHVPIGWGTGRSRGRHPQLLRATLLAPDIQEAIIDGRQPKGMQLEDLTPVMPSGWDEQRESVAIDRSV